MAEPLPYLELVGSYWSLLGAKTLFRAKDAINDIENDSYTYGRFARDILGFYNDSLAAWFAVLGKPDVGSGDVPTLSITVPMGTDSATGTLPLKLDPATPLGTSPLLRSGALKVPQANVSATVMANGDLRVTVSQLNSVPVGAGVYKGVVTSNSVVLAKVALTVT
jgi:hypothetical protein